MRRPLVAGVLKAVGKPLGSTSSHIVVVILFIPGSSTIRFFILPVSAVPVALAEQQLPPLCP